MGRQNRKTYAFCGYWTLVETNKKKRGKILPYLNKKPQFFSLHGFLNMQLCMTITVELLRARFFVHRRLNVGQTWFKMYANFVIEFPLLFFFLSSSSSSSSSFSLVYLHPFVHANIFKELWRNKNSQIIIFRSRCLSIS